MKVIVSENKVEAGRLAAASGAKAIRAAIRKTGRANIIVATGASQFEMLEALVKEEGIAWNVVTGFHLDEYVGMAITHPASFRGYLWARFVSRLPLPLAGFHYLNADKDPAKEAARVGAILAKHPIDVAFVGIGENGHLAFNDPPADFKTTKPYLVVKLDHACRQQQFGEGWFKTFKAVPTQAISMSCRQIMKASQIIVTCPDVRKAAAVKATLEGPVSVTAPASILQGHKRTEVYLDAGSASLL